MRFTLFKRVCRLVRVAFRRRRTVINALAWSLVGASAFAACLDTTPPTISCVGGVTNEWVTGAVAVFAIPSVTDDTDTNVTITFVDEVLPAVCPYVRIYRRTWTATDDCTNRASCSQTIAFIDTTPPVITCPPNRTNEWVAGTVPLFDDVTASDSCDTNLTITFVDTALPAVCPYVRILRRTWTATDDCTNRASCSQTLSFLDTPPSIGCPPNQIVPTLPPLPASLSAFLAAGGTATDSADTNLEYHAVDGPLIVNGCRRTLTRTHTVTDDCRNNASCDQIFTLNQRPVCVIGMVPEACGPAFGDPTNLFVISLNRRDACLILDGARSFDPDNDPLDFIWSEGGTVLGTTAVVTNCLALGCYTLTFTASDCVESCTNSLGVCVLTACDAVEQCIALLESFGLPRQSRRPLIVSLKAACASFERDNLISGLNQLEAFQNKVRAQLDRSNPVAAQAVAQCTQQIIDAIACAVRVRDHLSGNNGVGNGLEPQPPGEPPINDGPGTGPGNPGQR